MLSLTLHIVACKQTKSSEQAFALTRDTLQVEAPFGTYTIQSPNFENAPRFPITDFGAEPADKKKNTEAIAAAIDSAHAVAGGTVVIPKGEWLTAKIHFK